MKVKKTTTMKEMQTKVALYSVISFETSLSWLSRIREGQIDWYRSFYGQNMVYLDDDKPKRFQYLHACDYLWNRLMGWLG